MTIQITRGPRGDGSPVISFVGMTTDGNSAADTYNNIFGITPQINGLNSDAVDIVDDNATTTGGNAIFVLEGVSYLELRDRQGGSFASAFDVLSYIQNEISVATDLLQNRISSPIGIGTSINVGLNSFFEFDGSLEGGCGYFWDRNTFPSANIEVARYDRRKISGIVTLPGTYQVDYEVANINGITTTYVLINVV